MTHINLKAIFVSAEFVRFLAAGGLAAFLQWSSRFLFDVYFSYSTSVVLAYGVGLASGFLLSRSLVFIKSQNHPRRQLTYFIVINLLGLPVVWAISVFLGLKLLPNYMGAEVARAVGNAIGILSPVGANYLLHKFVTFRVS